MTDCTCKCCCRREDYAPECKLCGCGGKYFTPNCSCQCHPQTQPNLTYPMVWYGTGGTGGVTLTTYVTGVNK